LFQVFMNSSVFINKVELSNYKSIKSCSVSLGELTFLVGQNGAGKSNFLDALRLVSDSLNSPLEHALRERGGINEVRRRSSGHPTHFTIKLHWQLPNGTNGIYGFKVGAQPKGGFEIQSEICQVCGIDQAQPWFYKVEGGKVLDSSLSVAPPVSTDRLYLVAAAGLPEFRPLYDALTHMGFYNLNPDVIREPQAPDPGEVLKRDGSNIASVLGSLSDGNKKRIVELLSKVVPGITDITSKLLGKRETLEFRQRVGTNIDPWRFMSENMSDGTLRALGVLTALFQSTKNRKYAIPLVGIEEPETAVHPGAAGILRDGIRLASQSTQVIVTSHSPDLLDDKELTADNILSVMNTNGDTVIAGLDSAGREVLQSRLYTAGELLRSNQLAPDLEEVNRNSNIQPELSLSY